MEPNLRVNIFSINLKQTGCVIDCISLDARSWPGPGSILARAKIHGPGQEGRVKILGPGQGLILARAKICISLELDFNWSKQIQSFMCVAEIEFEAPTGDS